MRKSFDCGGDCSEKKQPGVVMRKRSVTCTEKQDDSGEGDVIRAKGSNSCCFAAGTGMGNVAEAGTEAGMEADSFPLSSQDGPSGRRRANRFWKKMKSGWGLVEYNALPEHLQDNEFILKYYRHNWTMKQILLSTFTIHNETINIWTHLVGFLLFLGLTIYTAKMIPKVVPDIPSFATRLPKLEDLQKVQSGLMTCLDSLPSFSELHLPEMVTNCLPASLFGANRTDPCVLQTMKDDMTNFMVPLLQNPTNFVVPLLQVPTARWPFFVFLGGAMFCLLASAACHLLSCHSELASYIFLRLDYAGIAALIAASFYPPVYYSFMCDPILRNVYLFCITSMGVATIVVSMIPRFQTPQHRSFRATLFFCMGVSGLIPCVHKLLKYGDEPAALHTFAYEGVMGLFYGLGATIYAARIPERWKPGRFDIAGNSHQLFHILVVMGAFTHYRAGLLYLAWRDVKGCS